MAKNAERYGSSLFGFLKLLVIVTIMSCTAFFLVFNNIKARKLDKRISVLQKQIIREAGKNRENIIRTEEVLSRSKIQRHASESLNMVKTRREDYIILR
jgi:hypothetical protein